MELLTIIIALAIYFFLANIGEYKFDNYMPPEGMTIDHNKMSLDKVQNRLSNDEVMRNTVAGKYNVPINQEYRKY